ncbi:RagB/SusD family nutrient uptake outer membrane protein [Chitinophaga horti]|uniref:RagB/SusD family nutrient uptake outer membrane protein n=1 Tax=Chitinophaga horti TaxID=2920382 RepID=A0ABY6J7A4_9BACT|nr:RagB/SusD family nutrient uptake outer membrane protein [Chitinophaga horti]UYQ95550.1 RagB/SusD family nutrient uptake outer membrane protein [Chitinophaga horti]
MRFLKHIKLSSVAAGLCTTLLLSACNPDFFEIEDPSGIEDFQIWEDEGAIGLFLNRTYGLVMPQWPVLGSIHNTSDELNNANTAFLYGQLLENSVTDIGTSASITNNRYADVRRCNTAIEGINSSATLSEAARKTLKGQFFFLRGFSYFKFVRLYGGVPLVLKAQGQGDNDLAVPRAKTSECIAQIGADMDSAAAYLPAAWTGNDIGRATRAAALAVKAKAFLYWASPQFNPTNNTARWESAYTACKAAYDQGVADGYGLLANYGNIFFAEDNKEVLIVRKYNASKDMGNNVEHSTRPFSETITGGGSNQPTWNLVQAYLMKNGLPITHGSSGYNAIQFWKDRDPRFNATIAFNGDVWPLSGKAGRKQWSYKGVPDEAGGSIATGFYCKRLVNVSLTPTQAVYNSNSGGGSGIDWIEMRFAEVMLNLAEAANETGKMDEAKTMVREVRKRAGIVEGAFDYGLALATDVASMRSLLLNERQIEFAFEGMRNYDLRRTRNLGLLTARQSYILAPRSPYVAGTGNDATKIYLDRVGANGLKNRDTANLDNLAVYSAMFNAEINSLEGANTISLPDKYYVYPLPNTFTRTSVIQQTIGWSGGTFDPYQ